MQRTRWLTRCWPPGTFQYPRSDRRRCNSPPERGLLWRKRPFSILGRIGGDATNHHRLRRPQRGHLSVSSVGSEAMQHRSSCAFVTSLSTFSILGRIGGDATGLPLWVWRWNLTLSVSSVGSEAMQQSRRLPSGSGGSVFQYPRSDRRRCNPDLALDIHRDAPVFQYPRSDRRRCNVGRPRRQQRRDHAFSILGRIGGDAT